jgi:hypothetical protein
MGGRANTNTRVTRRFQIAGVELELVQSGAKTPILGFYDRSPSSGGPIKMRVSAECIPGFSEGRKRSEVYPGFVTRPQGENAMTLERFDVEGVARWHGTEVEVDVKCHDSPNSLEAAIRIAASIALPRNGALILHSSAVADAHGAHVFSGVSGAGKSTISTMLSEAYPLTKLSDELVLVRRLEDGSFAAQVSPFIGSVGLPIGDERPLRSINFLVQAPQHQRTRLLPVKVITELCKHVLTYARDPETSQCVLDLVAAIALHVPAYELRFAKRPDVGEVMEFTC